ncbi:MAG: VWA domain-containing protein [Thermodesulfobacteriota bacterium]
MLEKMMDKNNGEFVIRNDAYDRLSFGSIKEESKELKRLEEDGSAFFSTFSPLMQDFYSALYKITPRMSEELFPAYELNRVLLEEAMGTQEFRNLKEFTKLDDFNSAMGVLSVGGKVLSQLPEDVTDETNMMMKAQRFLEGMMTEVDSLDDLSSQAKGKKKQKYHGMIENLNKQINEVEALVRNHGEKIEKLLDGKKDDIRRIMRKVCQEAMNDVQETSEFLDTWGSEPGKPCLLPVDQKLELGREIMRSNKLKQIAKIAGRFQRIALHKQATKTKHGVDEIVELEIGNDLGRIVPSELVRLAHPILKMDFMRKYHERQLLQYRMEGVEKKGRGPIVFCCDSSGSMEGANEIWSKAVMLGLLTIARKEKRNMAVIHFGNKDQIKTFEFVNGQTDPHIVVEAASWFFGGGTDFEAPLHKSMDLISQSEWNKADIVFCTDGECGVSEEFLAEYLEIKKSKEFKCFSILLNVGINPNSDYTLKLFSDDVATLTDLSRDGEAIDLAFTI